MDNLQYSVSVKHLEKRIKHLNYLSGFTNVKYETIGAYFLGGAYGGYSLEKRLNEKGGVDMLIGYLPKRDIYNFVNGMISIILEQRNQERHKRWVERNKKYKEVK